MEVPRWKFEFEGKKYVAVGNWEIGWVRWGLYKNKKALRSFIKRELLKEKKKGR